MVSKAYLKREFETGRKMQTNPKVVIGFDVCVLRGVHQISVCLTLFGSASHLCTTIKKAAGGVAYPPAYRAAGPKREKDTGHLAGFAT